jgi:hypothetical protein
VDWLDPESWKTLATLAEHWQKIAVAAVAILGALGSLLKWGWAPVRWLLAKFRAPKSEPSYKEERPLRFVFDEQQSFWGPLRRGDRTGTQLAGHWNVTNISDRDIVLLGVRLVNHRAEMAQVLTPDAAGIFSSRNPISAHQMSQVTTHLTFFPAICDGYDPLIVDLIFTDNYESEYVIRQARFRPLRPAPIGR